MRTLEDIRKLAELNLCQQCYPKYVGILEPNIKATHEEFFHDWQSVEAVVMGMCLKHKGAFLKENEFFLEINENELDKFKDHIDADIYRSFKHENGRFIDRIKYLKREDLIGENLYLFLDKVSKRRNKVHKYKTGLSEHERILFFLANQLILQMKFKMEIEPQVKEVYKEKVMKQVEDWARQYLKFLDIA